MVGKYGKYPIVIALGLLVLRGGLGLARAGIGSLEPDGPAALQWRSGDDLPQPAGDGAAFVLEGTLYHAGGWAGDPAHPLADVYAAPLSPEGEPEGWDSGPSLTPRGRFGAAVAVYGSWAYLIGGYDGQKILDRVDRFDGANWQEVGALPTTLNFPAAAALHGRLYVAGGLPGPVADVRSAPIQEDGSLGEWRDEAALPRELMTRLAVWGECLYAVGGRDKVGEPRAEIYRAKWNGDAIAGWIQITSLPQPLALHGVAVREGVLYVLGGEASGGALNGKVYAATIQPDCTLSGWATEGLPGEPRRRVAVTAVGRGIYLIGGQTGGGFVKETWYDLLPLIVEFTAGSQSGPEDVGTMTATLRLSAVSGLPVTVPFTASGTATEGADNDYTITPSPAIIPAGSLTATIVIAVNDDSLDEEDETIVVTLGTPTNAGLGDTTVHTATILDNDPPPTVDFTAGSQSGPEDVGTMTATLRLSAVSGLPVTVPFTVSGTATEGADNDYTITPSPAIIPAGSTATIVITVNDDPLPEEDETVVVTLGTPTNARLGGITVHTATILDNEPRLSVWKEATPFGPVGYGDVITYAIHYGNPSHLSQTGVVVTDRVPSGTAWVGATPPPDEEIDRVLRWSIDDLAAGADGTITFTVVVSPPQRTWELTKTMATSWLTSTLTPTLRTEARITYTIFYTPVGVTTTAGLLVTDTLPDRLAPLTVTAEGNFAYAVRGHDVIWRVERITGSGRLWVMACVTQSFTATAPLDNSVALYDGYRPVTATLRGYLGPPDESLVVPSCPATMPVHPSEVPPLHPDVEVRNRAWIYSKEIGRWQPGNEVVHFWPSTYLYLPLIQSASGRAPSPTKGRSVGRPCGEGYNSPEDEWLIRRVYED